MTTHSVLCRLVIAWVCAASLDAADGPGLGNQSFTASEVGTVLSRFTSANGVPRGHGFPVMHRGRLWVIFSNDGGGGGTSGGFGVFDISDPRAPTTVFTTVGKTAYAAGGAHDASNIREPHAITMSGDFACVPTNKGTGTGLQFWNWADATNPIRVSQIALPGLVGGDYDSTPWWAVWQGRRVAYVAGTANGLYLVDATDPANPVLVNRGAGRPNPIPTSELGGFRVGVVWAIGNLLVIANGDRANGISVLDIADPANPVLLSSTTTQSVGYSCHVAGDRIYGCHDPARVWDISDPSTLTLLGTGSRTVGTGGYGSLQDDHFLFGSSSAVVKMRIDAGAPFAYEQVVVPSGFSNTDWDFCTPLGNLMWAGNDHGTGSALLPHQAAPDTTGPAVTMVSPKAGAASQAVTSRVGIVFSDSIDGRSLSTGSLIVRPVGGSAIAGTYSVQLGVVNFWPAANLLPGTTYEVVVPAGGVKDLAGNGASAFISTFTTAGSAGPAVVLSTGSLSVGEGGSTTCTVRLSQAPTANVTVAIGRTGDSDLAANPSSLTFTSATWSTPQTVTISAAQDADALNGSAMFTASASGHASASCTAVEADDDTQALVWSTGAISVAEGATGSATLRLAAQPATNVTVTLSRIAGDADLSVSPASLTFTSANWNTPQTATISAAQDADLANGSATITASATGIPSSSLTATEADDDTQGLVWSTASVAVAEGSQSTVTLRLAAQPASTVSVAIARSTGDADLVVTPTSLSFTSTNWNAPQTVTISAAEDADTANGSATIAASASGIATATLSASESDNDTQALVWSTGSLAVAEGGSATATLRLAAQPAATVSVTVVRSAGDGDLSPAPTSLSFTTANWNTPQTITISAAQDADASNSSATIAASAIGLATATLTASEIDDDTQALVWSLPAVTVGEGTSAAASLRLAAQPAGSVVVTVARSAGDGDLAASPTSVTFTTTTWSTPQTITISASQDADATNGSATITASATGIPSVNLAVTEADDDSLELIWSATTVTVNEGSSATASLRLSAQPSSTVTVSVARSAGDSDLSVSPTTVTYTTANWSIPQTITVNAAQDADAALGTATITATATGVVAASFSATENDDDTPSIVRSTATVTVAEGGSASATLRLSAQPTANVTVSLIRSAGDADVSVSPGTLTFTTANWNTPQTFVISAAWDADTIDGSATITASATGWQSASLTATENDDAGGAAPVIGSSSLGAATITVGSTWTATADVRDSDTTRLTYRWNWGDGSAVQTTNSASASHVFTQPGHPQVLVTVSDGVNQVVIAHRLTVHRPLTAGVPRRSTTILSHAGLVWSVNSDGGTVAAIDPMTLGKIREVSVGNDPRALTVAADGSLWVANQGSDSVSVIAPATGAVLTTITLPPGCRPAGIVTAPTGSIAYVACTGDGRLRRIDTATRTVTDALDVGPTPRALALTHDGARLLVTRFISPDASGVVTEVSTSTFSIVRTIPLAMDPGPDTDVSGRGLPNYLAGLAISPDGRRAWVAAKKDNVQRGGQRDGQNLTFESTVRTITSTIDLTAGSAVEVIGERIDYDNADSAVATCFSPLGDWAFVALQGSGAVAVVDTAGNQAAFRIDGVGIAPQGLCLGPDGRRLFVQNFLSRNIAVYDLSRLLDAGDLSVPRLGATGTQASEPLSAQVLLGKKIFYHAADPRMSRDGYISCASCHVDGSHDGRTWDFTDRGEGLRNTTDLRGRRGTGHGRVHWSGNFDEIQDFENDMRNGFGGSGFLSDADFAATSNTLGTPKAGRSVDLDALAAYVTSLNQTPKSPHRAADGSRTASATAGRTVFARMGCAACHGGDDFTDSSANILHDVGTITAASGKRLGATLTGIDTPTLRGLWTTAPYLHRGQAATLADVFTIGPIGSPHTVVAALSASERADLISFLQQIDANEPAVPADGGGALIASIVAHDAGAGESAGNPGAWTISLSGPTGTPLSIGLVRSGTAGASDLATIPPTSVVIPAGASSIVVPLSIFDDSLFEGSETVTLTIASSSAYTRGSNFSAIVTIADNDALATPTGSVLSTGGTVVAGVPATLTTPTTAADPSRLTSRWSWGDGTPDTTVSGTTATHTWSAPGTYVVTVTITDSASGSSLAQTWSVAVVNASGSGGGGSLGAKGSSGGGCGAGGLSALGMLLACCLMRRPRRS